MPKNRKKFISKDKSVTFHLVHRSQQDPLIADEKAPQHVLVPQGKRKSTKTQEEEHKFGIFFDDDYNYLQHLRGTEDVEVIWEETAPKSNIRVRSEKPKEVQLPSSVFASNVEEEVGLLNKAAPVHGPRLDLDPDIVAAMDEDFDFDDPDNQLEDDFIALANQSGDDDDDDDEEEEEYSDELSDDYGSDCDELGSLPDEFKEVETKSRFTDYSLSSSVIRRNDQLTLLDDRFEKFFQAYEQNEIGALDCDEIEGDLSTTDKRLAALADEYNKKNEKLDEGDLKDKVLELVETIDDEVYERIIIEDKKEKWDCESILSTYSNIYNHPAKITEPKGPSKIRVNKAGVPIDELDGRGGPKLTAKNLATLAGTNENAGPKSIISMVSELSIRPKDETPEEKKQRKALLREYRKERRIERKANTAAFTLEKIRQEKMRINQSNTKGLKIL